jgi:DNA-binding transcriptional MerR regulator
LIRALREVGFDLDTIGQLLESKIELDDAIRMRAEALEAEQRTLRRRQLLLRAATNGKRKDVLARLKQKHVLARLDRFERETFLETHFSWAPHDTPESQAVWRAAIFDLPEQMDDAQLEAWLELAEIAADEGFHGTLKRQFEWSRGLDESRASEWNHTFQRLLADVREFRERSPNDEPPRTLIDAWIGSLARLYSRPPDAEFTRWMLKRLESTYDERIGRYWELMSRIKGIPYDPTYVRTSDCLLNALRERVSANMYAKGVATRAKVRTKKQAPK